MDATNVATDVATPTTTPDTRATHKLPTAIQSLPGIAYTDPELYEQELTEVFERAWILVGHVSDEVLQILLARGHEHADVCQSCRGRRAASRCRATVASATVGTDGR